jgi:hypothetical protein
MKLMHRLRSPAILIVLAIVYLAGWHWRYEVGISKPMANLRYFYCGSHPCTVSDSLLYWLYWPLYKQHLAQQKEEDGRFDVHWSDREGGRGYEHLCEDGRILGV